MSLKHLSQVCCLLFCAINSNGQIVDPCPPLEPTELSEGGIVEMSSVEVGDPYYTIDGIYDGVNTVNTYFDFTPFWEIDLGIDAYLDNVIIFHGEPEPMINFWVIRSNSPTTGKTLNELLMDPGSTITHINSPYNSGDTILTFDRARYVRIQKEGYASLVLSEVIVNGNEENCGNGIDDDCDQLVDCADPDCIPYILNMTYENPTCPICNDGKICIQAFRVNSISFDGGQTWLPFAGGYKCFEGLGPGTYDVKVKNNDCGEDGSTINLETILGSPGPESCPNGGVEQGNFNGWTGSYGTVHDGEYTATINEISIPDHHNIVPTSTPSGYLPVILQQPNSFGNYVIQLGVEGVDGAEGEEITYCLTVDENNKDFNFRFAVVIQDPGHVPSINNPFFQYKIYEKNDPINVIEVNKYASNNSFFQDLPLDILKVRGWTCANVDLSAYVGQEVCIEFINGDCSWAGHWSTTYVDGICSSVGDNEATVEIIADELQCVDFSNGMPIEIAVNGSLYSSYKWTICKVNQLGEEENCYEYGIRQGYVIFEFDDNYLSEYNAQSGYALTCNDKIKLKLDVFGDCGSASDELEIQLQCGLGMEVEYCEYLFVCNYDKEDNPVIVADGSCNDCTYSWSPSNYFIDPTARDGVIDRDKFTDALNRDYTVVVSKPGVSEICEKERTISVRMFRNIISARHSFEQDDYCTFKLSIFIDVKQGDLYNYPPVVSIFFENSSNSYNLILDLNNSTPQTLKYSVEGLGEIESGRAKALIEINSNSFSGTSNVCFYPNDCNMTIPYNFQFNPESHFLNHWRFHLPETFTPNCDGTNDYWKPQGVAILDDACTNFHPNTSIYYMKLLVFNRWGGMVYEKEAWADLQSGLGLDGTEIQWDGCLNGQFVGVEAYTYKLTVRSCPLLKPYPCSPPDNITNYGSDGVTVERHIYGDVTIVVGNSCNC